MLVSQPLPFLDLQRQINATNSLPPRPVFADDPGLPFLSLDS
jgi:hypothetical protein